MPKCRGRTSQNADIAKDIVPEIRQPGVVSVGSCVHSYEVNQGGEGGEAASGVNQGVSELWIGSEVNWLIGKGVSDLTASLATY